MSLLENDFLIIYLRRAVNIVLLKLVEFGDWFKVS